MWKALLRDGEIAPRCQVQRLMAVNGIVGREAAREAVAHDQAGPDGRRRPDLVKRDFTAEAPDRLWVGDFTYLRCWEGVAYFAFIIDVFSRKIVGWQLAAHMRTTLVLDALRMALGLREPGADFRSLHHTDTGSQYTSRGLHPGARRPRVLASIGTVGDAYDNALAEIFRGLLQDRADRRPRVALARPARARRQSQWVGWFNHQRLHESLGDIPPVEFEAIHQTRQTSFSGNGSVTGSLSEGPQTRLQTRQLEPVGAENLLDERLLAQAAPQVIR